MAAHEHLEKIEGTLESRVAAKIGGEVFRAPGGFLLRAYGMDRIFPDITHLQLELSDLVARSEEARNNSEPPSKEVPSARLRPDEMAQKKGTATSPTAPRTESKQDGTAEKEAMTEQRPDWSLVLIQLGGAATALYLSGASDIHWPYLQLGRLVIFGVTGYVAYVAASSCLTGWAWLISVLAVAFNPLFRVPLNLQDWFILDLVVAIGLAASIFRVTLRHERHRMAMTVTLSGVILLSMYVAIVLIEGELPDEFHPVATEATRP
jgi:hypothetical protein